MSTESNTAGAERERVPAYSWYALAILCIVYLLNFVDRQILSILANDIKADLQIGDAELGFLYGTAFAIFYALFGIPLGRLADSTHRLRLLSAGLALWSLMTMLSGFAKNLVQLSAARTLVGVGEAAANPCAYSLIADWFPSRMRATALAIYSSGLFVGSGLSLLVGGLIVEQWNRAYPVDAPLGLAGWQAAFVLVGLPGLVLAVWLLTLREPNRDGGLRKLESPGRTPWADFGRNLSQIIPPFTLIAAARRNMAALRTNMLAAAGFALLAWGMTSMLGNGIQFALVALAYYAVFSWCSALRTEDPETFAFTCGNRSFIAVVLVYSAVCFMGYSITYWAAPFAERNFAFGKTELGLLIGAPNALGGFLGVIGGGWAADRCAQRWAGGRLFVLAGALALPVPLVLAGYGSGSPVVFLVCNVLAQAATASALGASAAASQALVPPETRGTAAAIFLLGPTLIGLALGPFTAGLVSEATGNLGIGVMATLLAAIPGIAVLAAAFRSYPQALLRAENAQAA